MGYWFDNTIQATSFQLSFIAVPCEAHVHARSLWFAAMPGTA
jgi:hypothetical protein